MQMLSFLDTQMANIIKDELKGAKGEEMILACVRKFLFQYVVTFFDDGK